MELGGGIDDLRRERRRSRVLLVAALAALVLLLAGVVPSPYSIEVPGPVVDTLGSVVTGEGDEQQESEVIVIEGAETFPTEGSINLLTVSIQGTPERPASWLSLVPALFDPSQRIAPRSEFFPEGVTTSDREAQNEVLMDSSQLQAAAAAFRALDQPVKVELSVAAVAEDGPSAGLLEPGDVLRTVDGEALDDFTELRERISAAGPGTELVIGFDREGEPRSERVTPVIPQNGNEALIGASISMSYELPADVEFTLSRIGGPSAGMTFALAVIDKLTPGSLVDGMVVSGTGSMSDTGKVGPIGGLTQKMWAASRVDTELFLMPIGNCADVPDRIPDGLVVAPVATLDEAVEAIETAAAGGEPAGLERCATGADQG